MICSLRSRLWLTQYLLASSVDTFLLHAYTFGFFLDTSQLLTTTTLLESTGNCDHHQNPTSCLRLCIHLIGTHLCGAFHTGPDAATYRQREDALLLMALRETAVGLSAVHPQRYLHTIQADTLLSYYFFHSGQLVEAKRHASSAASLVLACGFHNLGSSNWESQSRSSAIGFGPSGTTPMQRSRNSVEEGERIGAFWTVFTLYRNIASAVNPASEICGVFDTPGLQIDTPWPLDMDSYKEVCTF